MPRMTKDNTTPPLPALTLEQANELILKRLERIAGLDDRRNQNSGNSSTGWCCWPGACSGSATAGRAAP